MRVVYSRGFFWPLLALVYSLSFFIQSRILLNQDVSWLLHVTAKLVAGGTYVKDFYEVNPPLILYLYIPPVLLSKWLSVSLMVSLRVYGYLLGSWSLWLCAPLVKRVGGRSFLLILLAVMFFIVPVSQFGQREHVMLILCMPYFIGMALRLQGEPLAKRMALGVGVLAALGVGIKPYFLIPVGLIELYYLVCTRNRWVWWRPEVLGMGLVMGWYLVMVVVFHRDYWQTVLPYVAAHYYQTVQQPSTVLLTTLPIFSCYIALLFYGLQRANPLWQSLRAVLALALLGFLAGYLWQQTSWFYHLLPAWTCALMLLALEFRVLVSHPWQTRDYQIALLLMSVIATMALYCETPFWKDVSVHPVGYLGLALLWVLLARQRLLAMLMGASLGVVLFAYASFFLNDLYADSRFRARHLQPVITFLQTYAERQPVMFFSEKSFFYPLADYGNAVPVSRFGYLGWVTSLVKRDPLTSTAQQTEKAYFVSLLVEDLQRDRPVYVLVDCGPTDIVRFLAEDPRFQQAWRAYAPIGHLTAPGIYRFLIYKRVSIA